MPSNLVSSIVSLVTGVSFVINFWLFIFREQLEFYDVLDFFTMLVITSLILLFNEANSGKWTKK